MFLVSGRSEDKERLMAVARDLPAAEDVLAAFDEHLRRVRGVCAGTRRNYGRYAGAFWAAPYFPDS